MSMEPDNKKAKVELPTENLAFHEFKTDRAILVGPRSKMIAVVGSFPSHSDSRGIVIAEKQPLTEGSLEHIFSANTLVDKKFQNDIYSQYELNCAGGVGAVKVTTVWPATEAHIKKYSQQSAVMITESPDDYTKITRPFIHSQPLSIDWVYNILDGTAESERVVYSDPDPKTGFVLLPDLKWDQKEKENLYMLAVVRKRGLLSLRELDQSHLPLLNNVLAKGKVVIQERYGLPGDELRCYVHYQPSYYHLHMHFTHLSYEAPRTSVGQSHLLQDVIENIQLDSDYYKKKTMNFVINKERPLSKEFLRMKETKT